jgi:hypothetical protein
MEKWHLDEVVITVGGRTHDLWRAVDAPGMVLDILVPARRHQEAAETFLRRVVKGYPTAPWVVVADKPASYRPAIKHVVPQAEHRKHNGLDKRAENSHQPTRLRVRAMRRFTSVAHARRLLEPFGPRALLPASASPVGERPPRYPGQAFREMARCNRGCRRSEGCGRRRREWTWTPSALLWHATVTISDAVPSRHDPASAS